MADERKYSDSEVQAIVERALKADAGGTVGLDHAELVAIGEQVGVAPEAMTRAAREVLEAQLDSAAGRAIKSRRRRWLAWHAGVFALINGLLFTVNFLTTPGEWWVLFSVFFWGLALALHAGLALGLAASGSALKRERLRLSSGAGAAQATPRVRVGSSDAASEPEDDVTDEASAPPVRR